MERTVRLPMIKANASTNESNPILATPNKQKAMTSSRMMNRNGGGFAATPRSLMQMATPTTDELMHVWTFICQWIHGKTEVDQPATVPGFGTIVIYSHSHHIRIPHFVAHPSFVKKYNLYTDDIIPPMSHALEYREIASHCNIEEYTAKSWLEQIIENIGDRMRTQQQVDLSVGVGIISCKNRYIESHITQKQPVQMESEVRSPESTPKKSDNPRSLMSSIKSGTSYIIPKGVERITHPLVPTKPSSPTTALIDNEASPRKHRGLVGDKRPTSPRFVLRQKFLNREDDQATTVLSSDVMPWDLNPNQADRVDTIKQLDAKYPPLLDPFCRTLGIEQIDGVTKLTCSDRIGSNYSLSASSLVIRKHAPHAGSYGLHFIDDGESRVTEHFVTLRPPSPSHDRVELPLVTTSGKPVYATDSVAQTLTCTRSLEGEKTTGIVPSQPKEDAVERYMHYLDKIIDDSDIVPMNPTWTEHIKQLISRAVKRVQSSEKESIVQAMLDETLTCYTYSIKKAILDYLLLRQGTRIRLNIPHGTPPEFQVHEKWKWGETYAMMMKVTPSWKERKARAVDHIKQYLMLIDTHLMALHYMWVDFDDLLLVDIPTLKEASKELIPFNIKSFEQRQLNHALNIKRILVDKWFHKAKRILTSAKNDEVLQSALLHPKHYFDSVATLMSLQLRRLVVRSIDAYVDFFKQFLNQQNKNESIHGLLLTLILDQSKIKFEMSLEDVQNSLLNILYNIPSCLTHIDRVETKFEPSIILGGSPFLWGVGLHEDEVVSAADTIRNILQDNLIHPIALRTKYGKYSLLAGGDIPVELFIAQNHDINSYEEEILKFLKIGKEIAIEYDWNVHLNGYGLFLIDCKELNKLLLKKASHFIQLLIHSFSDTTLRLNRDIRQQFKLIAGRLARKPIDLHELVESEAYITKLRSQDLLGLYDNVDHIKKRIQFLFQQCTIVRDSEIIQDLFLSSDLLGSTLKTFQWKNQIDKILRDGDTSLQHERTRIETAFIAKRSRFQAELEEIEGEVNSFQKKSDLRHATTYVVQLGKIRDGIAQARHTIDIISDEESKLGWIQTDFNQLDYICETLDPYDQLWRTARDFREASVKWMRGNIFELDAKGTEKNIHSMIITLTNATKQLAVTSPAAVGAAETLKKQIFEFKESIGIISVMGNPNLRDRHWTEIAETVGFIIDPTEHITLQRLLDLGVLDASQKLQDISESATMEAEIERSLDTMAEEWLHMEFKFSVCFDTFLLNENSVDDIHIKLDDHIIKTQTIRCSQYRKPFFGRAIAWERSLLKLRDMTDLLWETGLFWKKIQPLFSPLDLAHSILDKNSNEAKKFTIVNDHWHQLMISIVARPLCLAVIQIEKAAERLRECLVLLEIILEGLTATLEIKRCLFTRFYFLSNSELITALTVSPTIFNRKINSIKTCHFLNRMFPGIYRIDMNTIGEITHVLSLYDETLMLNQVVPTEKMSTDVWLGRLELQVQTAVQVTIRNAIHDYTKKDFRKWTNCWPEQIILSVDSYMWSMQIEKLIQDSLKEIKNNILNEMENHLNELIHELNEQQNLNRISILTNTLTQIIYRRDITNSLLENDTIDIDSFEWQSQLRYTWNDGNLQLKCIKSSIPYGYEYVGNRMALVIVPNTLKCARVVFSAFSMMKGTSIEGPSGAGKSATCRSLATTCAKLFVLFSCVGTSQVDELARMLKGVASCGAWFCLDDSHNIIFQDLGIVMEMMQKIQQATQARETTLTLQGVKLRLKRGSHILATFQSTCKRLPVYFQCLFRPVVIATPNLRYVAQVLFFVAGFTNASRLGMLVEFLLTTAQKLITRNGPCENVATLAHISTIVKQTKQLQTNEQVGSLQVEKLTIDELLVIHVLFEKLQTQIPSSSIYELNGLMKDMLQRQCDPLGSSKLAHDAIKLAFSQKQLIYTATIELKLNQLHQVLENHIGVLLLGSATAGKTTLYQTLAQVYKILEERLNAFSRRPAQRENNLDPAALVVIAPRSLTLDDLFGRMAPTTKSFQDGVLTLLLRKLQSQVVAGEITTPRSWLVLDGEIDSFWADGFNTLLDDTGQHIAVTGETIPLPPQSRFLFELSDASSASPSIITRCAIVHVEGESVTWRDLYTAWMDRMPEYLKAIEEIKEALDATVDMIEPALEFIRLQFQSTILPIARVNALFSFMDAFLRSTYTKMGSMTSKQSYTAAQCIFLQSLVWGIGHTTKHDERIKFDSFLRSLAGENAPAPTSTTPVAVGVSRHLTVNSKKINMFFPNGRNELVYSFGLSSEWGLKWEPWIEYYPNHCYIATSSIKTLSELHVPTSTTSSAAFFLDVLTQNNSSRNHVLLVGPRDSGKTAVMDLFKSQAAVRAKALMDTPTPVSVSSQGSWDSSSKSLLVVPQLKTAQVLSYTFSACTTPSQLFRGLENHLERSRKNVLSAPSGKVLVLLLEDVSCPAPRPPTNCALETLRHIIGFNAIYEPKTQADCIVSGLSCVASLTLRPSAPHRLTSRLTSKFVPIALPSIQDADQTKLLTGIAAWFAQSRNLSLDYTQLIGTIVKATIRLYHTCVDRFRVTPKTPHYSFSLSDMVQVLHMVSRDCVATAAGNDKSPAIRLWCHEATRHFHDRLINSADSVAYFTALREICTTSFSVSMESLFPTYNAGLGLSPSVTNVTPTSTATARRNSRANHGSIDRLAGGSLRGAQQQSPALMFATFQHLCYTELLQNSQYSEINNLASIETRAVDELKRLTEVHARPSALHADVDIRTPFAIEHIVRLYRLIKDYSHPSSTIRQDHVVLLGRSGTGKHTLARVASALTGSVVISLHVQAPSMDKHWRGRLNEILIKIATENKPTVVIIKDVLVNRPQCLMDLHGLVNGEFVPTFISHQDMENLAPVLREAAKDHNIFLESPPAVEAFCIERLQRLLKFVIIITTGSDTLERVFTENYHFLDRCRLHYIDMWPEEAFFSIAQRLLTKSYLTDEQAKLYSKISLQLYHLALPYEISSCPITPSRIILQMIMFAKAWSIHHTDNELRKTKLTAALDTLRYVEKLANKVNSSVLDLQPAIHQVHETSKVITVGMTTDNQAILLTQRKLEAENSLCREVEERIRVDQSNYDTAFHDATNDFIQTRDALRELSVDDLESFLSLTPIPMIVKNLYECLGRLLHVTPIEICDERDTNTRMMDFSPPTIIMLKGPIGLSTFFTYTTDYVANLPDEILGPLVPIYESIHFTPKDLGEVHSTAGKLCAWVRALLHYRQMNVMLKPQADHLEVQGKYLATCVEKCNELQRTLHEQTREMELTKASRREAEEQLRDLVEKLTDHSTAIEKAQVVLVAMNVFVQSWSAQRDDVMEWSSHIAGDILVATGALMYGSHLPAFGRRQLYLEWIKALHRQGIFTSEGLLTCAPRHAVSDILLNHQQMQRWLALGVPDDTVCRENVSFLSSDELFPLLIDPHRIAYNWVMAKDMTESKTPTILWPTASTQEATEDDMYRALEVGRPVVFPSIDHIVKAMTWPLLLAKRQYALHGSGQPNILSIQDKLLEFHPGFSVYLFTTDIDAPSLPLFASLTHVIRIELTPQTCTDLFRAEYISNSSKHTAHHWKELRLTAMDSIQEARRLEDECLNVLSRSKSEETIFSESSRLFTWRSCHTEAINRFELVQAEYIQSTAMPLAMDMVLDRFIDLCLAADDLSQINRTAYSFSLSWIVALLTQVFEAVGRENTTVLQAKMTNMVYRSMHWAVFAKDRDFLDLALALRVDRSNLRNKRLKVDTSGVDEGPDDTLAEDIDQGGEEATPSTGIELEVNSLETKSLASWEWSLLSLTEFQFLVDPTPWPHVQLPIPCPPWISEPRWTVFSTFCSILPSTKRREIISSFQSAELKQTWKQFIEEVTIFDIPVAFTSIQELCVVRALRPDLFGLKTLQFTKEKLSMSMIASAYTWSIVDMARTSSCKHPLLVIASSSTSDGMDNIQQAAVKLKADLVVATWQPGIDDGGLDTLLASASKTGQWIVLPHAETNPTWLTRIDNLYKAIDLATFHWDFRVWICVEDVTKVPPTLVRIAMKRVHETSNSFREQLLVTSSLVPQPKASNADTTTIDGDTLRSCFLHASLVGRSQFGLLGWHESVHFDLNGFVSLIYDHLHPEAHVYGAKLTTTWDTTQLKSQLALIDNHRDACASLLATWTPRASSMNTVGSLLRLLRRASVAEPPPNLPTQSSEQAMSLTTENLTDMPTLDDPTWFGLASTYKGLLEANATKRIVRTMYKAYHSTLCLTHPRPRAPDEQAEIRKAVHNYSTFEKQLEGCLLDIALVKEKCPQHYDSPLHAVIQCEVEGFLTVRRTLLYALGRLQALLADGISLPPELASLHASIQANLTPLPWLSIARSKQTCFETFQSHLLRQMKFFETWIQCGPPNIYWIGAFLHPTHFFTAILQLFSRLSGIALHALSLKTSLYHPSEADAPPTKLPSVLIDGFQLMGVSWEIDESNSPEKKLIPTPSSLYNSPMTIRFSAFVVNEYECFINESMTRQKNELPVPIYQELLVPAAYEKTEPFIAMEESWYDGMVVKADLVGIVYIPSAVSAEELSRCGVYLAT